MKQLLLRTLLGLLVMPALFLANPSAVQAEEMTCPAPVPVVIDIKPGDSLTLTYGDISRTHIVRALEVSTVDSETDTVSGTAEDGALVYVWAHGYGETQVTALAEDGAWTADLGTIPFDLLPGMCGRSEIRDGSGSSTAVVRLTTRRPSSTFGSKPKWSCSRRTTNASPAGHAVSVVVCS